MRKSKKFIELKRLQRRGEHIAFALISWYRWSGDYENVKAKVSAYVDPDIAKPEQARVTRL